MNTKLLRQKIFDLAIRGKLTDQRKSDGTTRELLEKISASHHSERSAKSAKSKDPTPITPLNKSEAPFEIPDNWEWVKWGDICNISSAKRVLKEDWKESGIPFYRAREIAQLAGGEKVRDDLFITKELYVSLKKQYGVPQSGDILMSAVGTIGKTYIVKETDCFYYKDASVICLKKKSENISSNFLKLLLASDFLQKQMYANSSGTTVDTITISVAQEYILPLPPLAEQQRVVEKIEEAFAEIDAVEKNKELLKTHIKQTRQKILDLAIHGKLVPQDENDEPACVLLEKILQEKTQSDNKKSPKKKKTDDITTSDNRPYEKITAENEPFEIPSSWKWVKYAKIINCLSVKEYQIKSSKILPTGKYPVVSQGQNFIDGYTDDAKKVVRLKEPIVLFGDHTRIVKYIDFEFVVGADGTKILSPKSVILPKYLYFTTQGIVNKMEDRGYGRHFALLANSLVSLPPLTEQKRIVDKIEQLFKSLDEISLHLV